MNPYQTPSAFAEDEMKPTPTERDKAFAERDDTIAMRWAVAGGREYARGVSFTHDGWTLSLALGDGSYSDGRDTTQAHKNREMEVAMIRPDDSFVPIMGDSVAGWVRVKYLVLLMECLYADVTPAEKEAEYQAIIRMARDNYWEGKV